MRHGNDKDCVFLDGINQTERKPVKEPSSQAVTNSVAEIGMFAKAVDAELYVS